MDKRSFTFRSFSVLLALQIFFTSCGSTLPKEIQQPALTSPISTAPTAVRPQWFWQGAWWERNGTLSPETLGYLRDDGSTQWVRTQASRILQTVTGTSGTLDWSRAYQVWDKKSSRQLVRIPMIGYTDRGISVKINPTWYFFGAHQQQVETVEYIQRSQLSSNGSSLTVQGVGGTLVTQAGSAYQNILIDSAIELNANGTVSNGLLITRSRATGKVLNTVLAPEVNNAVQLKALTDQPLALSALIVNPCALTTSALVVNPLPPCPPPLPATQEPDFSKFPPQVIDPVGKVSPFPLTPIASDPILFNKSDCQGLAQAVTDAKEDVRQARDEYNIASGLAFIACGTSAWFLFLNPAADVACVGAAAAGWAAENNWKTMVRRLARAEAAYSASCPK
jgi:hypothetical protein